MSGLVGYGSSDEEDDEQKERTSGPPKATKNNAPNLSSSHISMNRSNGSEDDDTLPDAPMVGPGSTSPAPNSGMIGPIARPQIEQTDNGVSSAPQSPYATSRGLIRNLTLPTVPNFDIPESPPGSPPPGMDKKFAHFLELKKQGVHFNEKLASSSALKNPSLLGKLMTFAGLEDSDQYANTLPRELWDPHGFPPWAYPEELAKAQEEAQKEREMAGTQREAIDFVPATGSSGKGPAPENRGSKGSAAERVMAGLDRKRTGFPQIGHSVTSSGSSRRRSRSPGRRR